MYGMDVSILAQRKRTRGAHPQQRHTGAESSGPRLRGNTWRTHDLPIATIQQSSTLHKFRPCRSRRRGGRMPQKRAFPASSLNRSLASFWGCTPSPRLLVNHSRGMVCVFQPVPHVAVTVSAAFWDHIAQATVQSCGAWAPRRLHKTGSEARVKLSTPTRPGLQVQIGKLLENPRPGFVLPEARHLFKRGAAPGAMQRCGSAPS